MSLLPYLYYLRTRKLTFIQTVGDSFDGKIVYACMFYDGIAALD